MKEIKISIIVPVYNTSKYLERCIDSILNQTLEEIEIILIDDGSTDNSGEICDRYKKSDPRINVIHKKNEGLGLTRNAGLREAKGTFVGFVDSDDYIEPNMYEKMYNTIQKNGNDAVICNSKRLTKDNNIMNNWNNIPDRIYNREEIEKEILPSICGNEKYKIKIGSVWKVLYKKSILDDYNIKFLNEREYVSEDFMFNLIYFSKCNRLELIKDELYIYCENQDSLTKKYRPEMVNKFEKLYNIMKKEIKYNKEECYQGLDKMYIQYMRVAIIQEVRMNPEKALIKNNIKTICNDSLLCSILKRYDMQYMTLKQKLFTHLMKHKNVNLLYLASKK